MRRAALATQPPARCNRQTENEFEGVNRSGSQGPLLFHLATQEAGRNDFRFSIRCEHAFQLFKRLLTEYDKRDTWNRVRKAALWQLAADWCKARGIPFRNTQP